MLACQNCASAPTSPLNARSRCRAFHARIQSLSSGSPRSEGTPPVRCAGERPGRDERERDIPERGLERGVRPQPGQAATPDQEAPRKRAVNDAMSS